MGCDIHLFVEYKAGDGPWTADKSHVMEDEEDYPYVVDIGGGRWYKLFAALAGVRGNGPDALGFPYDVSPIIDKASEIYGGDGHSHSYADIKTFIAAMATAGHPYKPSDPEGDDWNAIVTHVKQQVEKLELDLESEKMLLGQDINTEVQARFVFFFDN